MCVYMRVPVREIRMGGRIVNSRAESPMDLVRGRPMVA